MLPIALFFLGAAAAASAAAVEPPSHQYKCDDLPGASCTSVVDLMKDVHSGGTVASTSAAFATRSAAQGGTTSPYGSQVSFLASAGRFTFNATAAETTDATLYDMASCSKIMGPTTAVAQLYQAGHLGLDDLVASAHLLGPAFASHGKGQITVRNLMLHNAGFPPDPNPGYWFPEFACPQTNLFHPGQDFSCHEQIYNDLLLNQTLVYPTGSKFIYSDLSMITAMYVVGKVARAKNLVSAADFPPLCADYTSDLVCNFYAYVDKNVFKRYGLGNTTYVPDSPLHTPPAWVSPAYHHGLVMGYVSDQNAYALGGISGHAGVFSTAIDALAFMRVWMDVSDPDMLNATTVKLFTTVANITQSSRALGWDTSAQPDPPCGGLSAETFFHIGFTGTQFCGDPVNGIMTVLLGNGRFPNFDFDGTIALRPKFNTLVLHELLPSSSSPS